MDGASHYREAERLLLDCQLVPGDDGDPAVYPIESERDSVANPLAAAQVHATLALAAATALRTQHEFYEVADDVEKWAEATGASALDEEQADDPAQVDHAAEHLAGSRLVSSFHDQNGGAV
jgi:hypothetical protein